MTRKHSDIVAAADASIVAVERGVSVHTVRSWGQRGRIPAEHWPAFVAAGVTTLDELAASVTPRRGAAA